MINNGPDAIFFNTQLDLNVTMQYKFKHTESFNDAVFDKLTCIYKPTTDLIQMGFLHKETLTAQDLKLKNLLFPELFVLKDYSHLNSLPINEKLCNDYILQHKKEVTQAIATEHNIKILNDISLLQREDTVLSSSALNSKTNLLEVLRKDRNLSFLLANQSKPSE